MAASGPMTCTSTAVRSSGSGEALAPVSTTGSIQPSIPPAGTVTNGWRDIWGSSLCARRGSADQGALDGVNDLVEAAGHALAGVPGHVKRDTRPERDAGDGLGPEGISRGRWTEAQAVEKGLRLGRALRPERGREEPASPGEGRGPRGLRAPLPLLDLATELGRAQLLEMLADLVQPQALGLEHADRPQPHQVLFAVPRGQARSQGSREKPLLHVEVDVPGLDPGQLAELVDVVVGVANGFATSQR